MKKRVRIYRNAKSRPVALNPSTPEERQELDRSVIDLVLRVLFENADRHAVDLNKDILDRAKIRLPERESQRIWDVLLGSGWVSPSIGFGKAGKLELTRAGFQMMSQFGGYNQYLASAQNSHQQTVILPVQIPGNQELSDLPRQPEDPPMPAGDPLAKH